MRMSTLTRKILVVNNAESTVKEFVTPIFNNLIDSVKNIEFAEYSDLPKTPVQKYEGIILSASPFGDDIVEHHLKYYHWLLSHRKPVLGICAGHQIIGRLFGGELLHGVEPENGLHNIIVDIHDEIFDGQGTDFETEQQHRDSVTCPEEFIVLAQSEKCPNQVMKHKDLPIYGVQFHAEKFSSWLIKNFIHIVERYGHSD